MPPRRFLVCTQFGCTRPHVARGLCGAHYAVAKRARRPEYVVWTHLRTRCNNPSDHDYPYYGGRGIRVCDRWDSFEDFLKDMGPRPTPKHTIDRIDNDGNYEPDNCRWATRAEQSRNRRPFHVDGRKLPHARIIDVDGVTDTVAGWARRLGADRSVVRGRLDRGWDVRRAVLEPVGTTPGGSKPKSRVA